MTAGQEALREAMRLEQARIYSSTVAEHRAGEQAADPTADTAVNVAHRRAVLTELGETARVVHLRPRRAS